jgi:multisubunit Na+/H+ antiporter MnhF subunit
MVTRVLASIESAVFTWLALTCKCLLVTKAFIASMLMWEILSFVNTLSVHGYVEEVPPVLICSQGARR